MATYNRDKAQDIKLEVFTPPVSLIRDKMVPFFSVREIASKVDDGHGGKYDVSFTLDYFSIERIDSDNMADMKRLEEDFSLPLGAGCSEFLNALPRPDIPKESFVMGFHQLASQSYITLAYDSQRGYLRRERYPSGVVSIWDLNEELLYSVDAHASNSLMADMHDTSWLDDPMRAKPRANLEVCSVMRVDDDSLGGAQRPHRRQANSTNIDVLQYLGASSLSYIGRGTVRDLPCSVYETILSEPPSVFAFNNDLENRGNGKFDYIVQFYLLRTATILENQNLIGKEFWPAKINLIKRYKPNGKTFDNYDMLDVSDFHWGLYGLNRKPSELFMAPECFDVENEQVRVDLLLDFTKNDQRTAIENEGLIWLRQNKYRLELELLNDLFKQFAISRLHLTEFELTLRSQDAVVNMVISDRLYDKKLVYSGLGEIPDEKDGPANRQTMTGIPDEQTCVLLGSHVTHITMIAYCPYVANVRELATCIVVFNDVLPIIKSGSTDRELNPEAPFDSTGTGCHMYTFSGASPPESGTQGWSKWRDLLKDHQFSFVVDGDAGSSRVTYTTRVRNFAVERKMPLQFVDNYRYMLDDGKEDDAQKDEQDQSSIERQKRPPKVRSFSTMSYDSIGDCARMCNLDVMCFSYSYCLAPAGTAEAREKDRTPNDEICLLSSLNIRDSDVNGQLISSTMSESDTVTVRDAYTDGTGEYNLRLANWCKIYEKDYLDSFSETGETITMPIENAAHYESRPSATECAKLALDVEGKGDAEQSHTIAYCPDSQACLFDSNLFEQIGDGSNLAPSKEDSDNENLKNEQPNESICMVFRRKYQTFFHVSPRVLKRASSGNDENSTDISEQFSQLPLELSTVEECARACWNQFGHVCASFDYCSKDRLCLINSIALDEPLDVNATGGGPAPHGRPHEILDRLVENRVGCLHYERDLRIDQLRRKHAGLRHRLLETSLGLSGAKFQQNHWSFKQILLKFVMFCALSVSFAAGIVLGKRVNERWDQKPLVMPGSNGIVNFINSLASSTKEEHGDAGSFDLDNYGTQSDGIQLEEMGAHSRTEQDVGSDELA